MTTSDEPPRWVMPPKKTTREFVYARKVKVSDVINLLRDGRFDPDDLFISCEADDWGNLTLSTEHRSA